MWQRGLQEGRDKGQKEQTADKPETSDYLHVCPPVCQQTDGLTRFKMDRQQTGLLGYLRYSLSGNEHKVHLAALALLSSTFCLQLTPVPCPLCRNKRVCVCL
jgi:hypothetical protein